MCIFKIFLGNNCPVGLYDGRIPDYDITASSEFNNDSSTYGAHLARLNNQPKDGNIGAWLSIQGEKNFIYNLGLQLVTII